jgi:hypothetical protein
VIETLTHKNRKARKEHECRLCWRTINPGETYNFQVHVDCGDLWTWKQCAHCSAMAEIIDLSSWCDPDEGYNHFSTWEYEPKSIAEARLIVCWRNRWLRKDGTLREVPEVAGDA